MRKLIASAFVFILVALASGGVAHAQRTEIALSTGYLGYSKSSFQFDVGPGIFYNPTPGMPWLQIGAEMTYQKIYERAGESSSMIALFGPVFNLNGANLGDAYFVSIGVAYKTGSSDVIDKTTADPYGVGYYLLFGRRINLGGTWSLRPSLGMVNPIGNGGIIFRPFAVSVRF